MDSPFIDVSVVPTYGKMQAQVVWRMRPGFEQGKFIIRRSPDGMNDWKEIGATVLFNSFIDADLITDGKLQIFYYQVILQRPGQRYDSPVINTLGTLSQQEFGAAYFIMKQEALKLTQGIKILVYKIRTSAPRCSVCVDPDTSQQFGTSLCEICYGTGFEGGYWPPITSYMQLLTESPKVQQDSPEGSGSYDPVNCKARMLAYPQLIKNDLIVDPMTDRRYLIEVQEISYLKGKAPIVSTADMVLLRHSDVRYKLALQ